MMQPIYFTYNFNEKNIQILQLGYEIDSTPLTFFHTIDNVIYILIR